MNFFVWRGGNSASHTLPGVRSLSGWAQIAFKWSRLETTQNNGQKEVFHTKKCSGLRFETFCKVTVQRPTTKMSLIKKDSPDRGERTGTQRKPAEATDPRAVGGRRSFGIQKETRTESFEAKDRESDSSSDQLSLRTRCNARPSQSSGATSNARPHTSVRWRFSTATSSRYSPAFYQ